MANERVNARWSFQKGDFVVEHIPQCNLCANKYKGCCLLTACRPPEEYWTNKEICPGYIEDSCEELTDGEKNE